MKKSFNREEKNQTPININKCDLGFCELSDDNNQIKVSLCNFSEMFQEEKKEGIFELVTGPMFAGKSKYLIQKIEEAKRQGETVSVFSPTVDVRDTTIKSRAYPDKKIPCTKISNPMDMTKSDSSIVVLDEFQFCGTPELLTDAVKELKKQHKKIIMAGLDLTAKRIEWENYTAMKKIADKKTKLTARCQICNRPAKFTKMVSGDSNKLVQIEGTDATYEPRCSCHYK